ncbi:MAG: DUF115 domain-containing protein [Treponema sp.]|nr:DUF115 domain-containing protein [Treponema sp.]
MSFWEANCAVLRKVYPGLPEELLRHDAGVETRGETAASGVPTLLVNGLYVHSPRDPAREGQRLAEACLAGSLLAASGGAGAGDEPVLVLGFGLGYAVEAVSRLAPQRPLVIIEKDPGLLRLAFELRDFRELLSRPGIAFVPGGDGDGAVKVLSHFEAGVPGDGPGYVGRKRVPLVLRNRTLAGIDEQWYGAVETRVRAWATQGDVNMATLAKFGRRWMRNLARNMAAIRDLPGISGLAGLAGRDNPVPVFLAAAGPTLDSAGPLLAEIRKRCIVVAVDTSLRFFHRQGVEPDFALVVDPQFWNSRHLDCMYAPPREGGVRTRLIAESAVYPPVLRLPFGGTFLCGSLFPLGAFVEKRVDPKGLLGAGGSVATSAWDFCRTLGAREIWVAGLDLAFPGGRTHFKGALFEAKALAESDRLKPAETFALSALRGGAPFHAPSVSGGRVLTDRRLSLYASWFESSLRNSPGVRNYRLLHDGESRQGGLAIPGFENANAETLLALPERRPEIDGLLETAYCRIDAEFGEEGQTRQRRLRYEEAITDLHSGLEKIMTACKKGEKLATEALHGGGHIPPPTIAEVNRTIAESGVKEIAGFLLPPEALAAMTAPEPPTENQAALREYLETCQQTYRSLEAASAEMAALVVGAVRK